MSDMLTVTSHEPIDSELITEPGKFEGQPRYVQRAWFELMDRGPDGDHDNEQYDVVIIPGDPEASVDYSSDEPSFAILFKIVLRETEQGFVELIDVENLGEAWRVDYKQTVAGVTEVYFHESYEQHQSRIEQALFERADFVKRLRFIAQLIEDEPMLPMPFHIDRRIGSQGVPEAPPAEELAEKGSTVQQWIDENFWRENCWSIRANNGAEARAAARLMNGEKNKMLANGTQNLVGMIGAMHVRITRTDQTCEIVEVVGDDGQPVMEEITVREEISPPKVREVVKMVPKTTTRCPDSILE